MAESTIRAYEPRDRAAIEEFFEAAWRDTPFPLDLRGAHADLAAIPHAYQVQEGGFWVLELDGRVVGAVAIRRLEEDVAELKRLAVRPEFRGRGLGTLLLKHAIAHASGHFLRVRLDTIREVGPAAAMFAKSGFVEIGRYNSNPDATLFMELTFAQQE